MTVVNGEPDYPRALALQFSRRAVARFSFIEMWERFGYFIIIGLLPLVLSAKTRDGGFGWSGGDALRFFGTYLSVLLISPLLGGWIADRWLGSARALSIGAALMALALFSLSLPHAIPLVIQKITGLDVAAILSRSPTPLARFDMLGASGFDEAQRVARSTNLALAWTFNSALILLAVGNGLYKPNLSALIGRLPHDDETARDTAFATFYLNMAAGSFLGGVVGGLLADRVGWHWAFVAAGCAMSIAVALIGVFKRSYIDRIELQGSEIIGPLELKSSLSPLNSFVRNSVVAVVLLVAVTFIACDYQLAGSIAVFSVNHVNRNLLGFTIPPAWFLALNPLLLVLLIPLLNKRSRAVTAMGQTWTTPHRFAFGLLLFAAAFFLVIGATYQFREIGIASLWWIVGACAVLTVGELFVGPVTYASVSRLLPLRSQGIGMGLLSAAFGVGAWLSGRVGAATLEVGESVVFTWAALSALSIAVFVWSIRRWLNGQGA